MRASHILLLSGLILAGCTLPRGAAMQSEVLAGAATEEREFQLVPVTRNNVKAVDAWRTPPQAKRGYNAWPRGGLRGSDPVALAVGDMLQLTIYDNEENSLLSAAEQKSSAIQNLQVASDGTIFLPYIGKVKVTGLSPDAAREKIQTSLEPAMPSAQVLLEQTPGRRNTVDMVGGVGTPGNYPLPDRSYSVLSLLSTAGGVQSTMENPVIRLIRGGQSYGISAETLFNSPQRDVSLRGGDKVVVEDDRRSFLALGASGGTQTQLPFTSDKVSALDAVTQMGGISPTRADPKGVLILREYPASLVRTDNRGPDRERVVFSVNLTTTDGLFSARNFQLMDNDVVLATESPITNTRTVLSLIGQTFGLVTTLQ